MYTTAGADAEGRPLPLPYAATAVMTTPAEPGALLGVEV